MDNYNNVNRKVIVITGGTGMLGREYANVLARHGASVVIVDLDQRICNKTAKDISTNRTSRCMGIACDISNESQVRKMMQKVEHVYGRIDVLINNAALNAPAEGKSGHFVGFEDFPLESWNKSIAVNLTGTFICTREALKLMLEKKTKGHIITIGSIYGMVAPIQQIYSDMKKNGKLFIKPVDYCVAKSALLNFTRYLAATFGKEGIRANTLTPGGVRANQENSFVKRYAARVPLGRMAGKTDFNGAILFLCSDASRYMTGSNLIIDGGWTCW